MPWNIFLSIILYSYLVYALKLAPKQVVLFRFIPLNSEHCSVKMKLCSVDTKCGAALIYGLRLGFSNSNLSSYTSPLVLYLILWVSAVCCKVVQSLSSLPASVCLCLRLRLRFCLCLNLDFRDLALSFFHFYLYLIADLSLDSINSQIGFQFDSKTRTGNKAL